MKWMQRRLWINHKCIGLSFIKVLLTCHYGIRSLGDEKQTGHDSLQEPCSGTRTCPFKGSKRGPSSTEPDPCPGDLSAFASSAGLNLQTWRGGAITETDRSGQRVMVSMPRAHFVLMNDTKHLGHKLFRLLCLAVITCLPLINPIPEWFTAPLSSNIAGRNLSDKATGGLVKTRQIKRAAFWA